MPKTRIQKEESIAKLTAEFQKAKSVVFADYQGLTVEQATTLRKKAVEANVDYVVAKKSLFTIAAKAAGVEFNAKALPGMLGAAFGTMDEVAPAKVLGDIAKTSKLKLVGGIFGGMVIGADKAIALSKLPSKKELLGQLVGTMYAPVSAFVRALNAIAEKNGTPSAPAPVEAPAPVVESAPAVETAPVAEVPAEAPVVEAPVVAETPAPEAPAVV